MRLLASLLLLSLLLLAQRNETKVLTVCEILQQLQKYRGKEIAVRGELRTGPDLPETVAPPPYIAQALFRAPPIRLCHLPNGFLITDDTILAGDFLGHRQSARRVSNTFAAPALPAFPAPL